MAWRDSHVHRLTTKRRTDWIRRSNGESRNRADAGDEIAPGVRKSAFLR